MSTVQGYSYYMDNYQKQLVHLGEFETRDPKSKISRIIIRILHARYNMLENWNFTAEELALIPRPGEQLNFCISLRNSRTYVHVDHDYPQPVAHSFIRIDDPEDKHPYGYLNVKAIDRAFEVLSHQNYLVGEDLDGTLRSKIIEHLKIPDLRKNTQIRYEAMKICDDWKGHPYKSYLMKIAEHSLASLTIEEHNALIMASKRQYDEPLADFQREWNDELQSTDKLLTLKYTELKKMFGMNPAFSSLQIKWQDKIRNIARFKLYLDPDINSPASRNSVRHILSRISLTFGFSISLPAETITLILSYLTLEDFAGVKRLDEARVVVAEEQV